LRFGNDSFKPHYAAAQATGKPCIVLESPGIALDVDNPEELSRLVATAGHTRAQRLARQWDIAKARLSNDVAPGAAPTNLPSPANE
jgi:2-phospho-L-lactate guanylyltransferase (CobY/MobA/RfbA family)